MMFRMMWSSLRFAIQVALAIVVIALAQAADPVLAQDTQPDPRDPVLPDIAPRVVEIRGQLEISMPSLERQPLIGFNPPPRVVTIPSDREPFVGPYKQESVDLPRSPLAPPEPPPVASLIGQSPRIGRLSASIGRYFSRTASFQSEWPLSERASIYSNADYSGSDGHTPFDEDPDITASFDALEAMVGVNVASQPVRFAFEIDGFLNQYLLYAAAPSPGASHLSDEPPMRDGRGGGIAGRLRTRAQVPVDFGLQVRYGVTQYETEALADESAVNDVFLREEQALEASADLEAPLQGGQFTVGDLSYTFLNPENPPSTTSLHMFNGGAGVRLAFGDIFQVTALARVMTYLVEDSSARAFVAPDISLDFYPTAGIRLYAQNRPRAEHHTSATLLRETPYLADGFLVRPSITTIDARGGGRFIVGVFEGDLNGGYQRAPMFRFFERASADEAQGFSQGFIAIRYEEAEIYYVGGEAAVILPAGLSISAGLTFRQGTLADTDEDIPYFGPILAQGGVGYAFAGGRGFIKASMTYESARKVARGNAREIGDFFDLDVEAAYDLTPNIGVVARAENLSAGFLERWEHYEQSPFVIGTGLRVRW